MWPCFAPEQPAVQPLVLEEKKHSTTHLNGCNGGVDIKRFQEKKLLGESFGRNLGWYAITAQNIHEGVSMFGIRTNPFGSHSGETHLLRQLPGPRPAQQGTPQPLLWGPRLPLALRHLVPLELQPRTQKQPPRHLIAKYENRTKCKGEKNV